MQELVGQHGAARDQLRARAEAAAAAEKERAEADARVAEGRIGELEASLEQTTALLAALREDTAAEASKCSAARDELQKAKDALYTSERRCKRLEKDVSAAKAEAEVRETAAQMKHEQRLQASRPLFTQR